MLSACMNENGQIIINKSPRARPRVSGPRNWQAGPLCSLFLALVCLGACGGSGDAQPLLGSDGQSFEPCSFAPGYGADESSSCTPADPTRTDPSAGCAADQSLLCTDPWNDTAADWGCQVGAPTPGFVGLGPLCGPDAGKSRDTPWLWDKSRNSCVLRGGDYPLLTYTGCGPSKYTAALDSASYLKLQEKWQEHAQEKAAPYKLATGETAYLVDVALGGGTRTVKAAMALGHGTLDGLCGDCFLIRSDPSLWGGEERYAVLLQAGVRAWSFEISPSAQNYLIENSGCKGDATTSNACCIPDVQAIDCSAVLD